MAKPGYVYILTNPSFRKDWVKIGKSARPVNTRCKELDNTAVPLPFEVYATLKTEEFSSAEKLIHKMIDRLTKKRIRKNREFFNIEPDVALDILRDVRDVLGGEIQIEPTKPTGRIEKNTVPPVQCAMKKQSGIAVAFSFSLAKVPIGAMVEFIYGGQQAKVVDERTVMYKNAKYTLSGLAKKLMPEERRNNSGAYQGPKYFKYKGDILTDRRERYEA